MFRVHWFNIVIVKVFEMASQIKEGKFTIYRISSKNSSAMLFNGWRMWDKTYAAKHDEA